MYSDVTWYFTNRVERKIVRIWNGERKRVVERKHEIIDSRIDSNGDHIYSNLFTYNLVKRITFQVLAVDRNGGNIIFKVLQALELKLVLRMSLKHFY